LNELMAARSIRQVVTTWRWELKDARRRSGWRLLGWAMTEEDAARWALTHQAVLRKVEGSREDRTDVSGNTSRPDASTAR
jgi:hypothetical protein